MTQPLTTETTPNGTTTEQRIAKLEHDLALSTWLLAEASSRLTRLATVVAAQMAQQMQPQMQKAILDQLQGL